jgi:ATP/maltotriose-dependent transcriptional regulator MalT/DNA-binding SARP family transcriptional activator
MIPILAKISRPHLAGIFPRERLFVLLDTLAAKPVTWLAAPAGSGKTALVSSYLESRGLTALWYQVDERDRDPATIFYYLGRAVTTETSASATELPPFTDEFRQEPAIYDKNFFEALFARLQPPAVIVLNDFQAAGTTSQLAEIIGNAVKVLPAGIRFIVTSRTVPPPELARCRAHRQLALLAWEDVRLSPEETAGILELRSDEVHRQPVQALHLLTDGWAAGITLLTAQGGGRGAEQLPHHVPAATATFDYFASEVFSDLAEPVREFLLKSAFLPRLTAAMAERLTGCSTAADILAELYRNGLFTNRTDDQETVYRYHPLFRQFLLETGTQVLTDAVAGDLERRAAAILIEAGEVEAAADLYHHAREWDLYISLITRYARDLLNQGRSATVLEWLSAIPAAVAENQPALPYWEGACRLRLDPAAAQECFTRAFTIAGTTGDRQTQLRAWAGAVDAIIYNWHDFTQLDSWLDWLVQDRSNEAGFPTPEVEAIVTVSMAGALTARRPQQADIYTWLERSLALTAGTGDPNLRLQAWVNAATYHLWTGSREKAGIAIVELRKLAELPHASPLAVLTCKWLEAACLTLMHADLTAALECVNAGLALAETSGVHACDHLLYGQGAYAAMSNGDLPATGEFLLKMSATLGYGRRHAYAHYHYLALWHELLADNTSAAYAHAESAVAYAEETGMVFPIIICHLAFTHLLYEMGDDDRLHAHLERACSLAMATDSTILLHMCLLAEAEFAINGDLESGTALLRRAMEIGRRQGYVNLFWWQPDSMARLCGKALECGIEVNYTKELIRRRNLLPSNKYAQIEQWPWHLKVYSLGRFGMAIEGTPVLFSGKVQQKPLNMLKALIALGGRNITEEQVTELLWPDAEGDVAHQSFATTLHRLRKMIGNDRVVLLSEGKIALNPLYCWVDSWAFERLAGQICGDRPGRPLSPETLLFLAEKALAIYSGQFMAGETDLPWTISMRERLRSKLLRVISKTGQLLEELDDPARAIRFYQKGLDCDELIEEFYQRLMTCYQKMGNRGEAISTYNRCKTVLSRLGVTPSPSIDAAYQRIISTP